MKIIINVMGSSLMPLAMLQKSIDIAIKDIEREFLGRYDEFGAEELEYISYELEIE